VNIKENLRRKYLKQRKNIDKEMSIVTSKQIIKNFLISSPVKDAKNIMSYISYKNEVNTYPLLKELVLKKSKKLFAPYCIKTEKRLEISLVSNIEKDLVPGAYGIPEPRDELRVSHSLNALDIVVVPAVAFSQRGYRIGYGGGYYDRFLDRLSNEVITIGLTYDQLLFDSVPKDVHDRSVDIVITESGQINCNKTTQMGD
jgi:5-formyltetrahydrofolate cyclo-ligase